MLIRVLSVVTLVAVLAARPELKPASEVVSFLSQKSSVSIYIDSRIAKERVPMPPSSTEVTEKNIQEQVESLTKTLPDGTSWGLLYLPPPPTGKAWKDDDVIAYARGQAQLYGTVGKVESETKQILSQQVPNEAAHGIISTLNLKRVYVIVAGRGNFGGVWNTTYGEMRLKQTGTRVSGTYTLGNGEIQGTVQGDVLRGRWYEQDSQQGGQVMLTLSKDGDSFSGPWGNDDSDSAVAGTWTGTRISR